LPLWKSFISAPGFFGNWKLIYVDDFFVDNANSEKYDSYFISNLKAGYSSAGAKWEWTLYFGINNLFDEAYISNVRINALGAHYFEPAPARNVYPGTNLRYLFDR